MGEKNGSNTNFWAGEASARHQQHTKVTRSDGKLLKDEHSTTVASAGASNNHRKRQRSRSRERVGLGQWGYDSRRVAAPISSPRYLYHHRAALLSVGPCQNNNNSIEPGVSERTSLKWHVRDAQSGEQQERSSGKQAGEEGLLLAIEGATEGLVKEEEEEEQGQGQGQDGLEQGQDVEDGEDGESKRDRSHRLAYMAWRGMDEELLRVMDESVYDDDDNDVGGTGYSKLHGRD